MKINRYALALDLKDDQDLIETYEKFHKKIWPEITASIRDAGVERMEIYRWGTRLLMIMEVNETFSFERKSKMDSENEKVREWEDLMGQFQQRLPGTPEGEKWQRMNKIFDLQENG